MFKTRIKNR